MQCFNRGISAHHWYHLAVYDSFIYPAHIVAYCRLMAVLSIPFSACHGHILSRLCVQYQLYTNTSPPPIYRRNSQKPNARNDEFPSLIHSPCGLSVNARPMDCHSRPLDPISQAVASFWLASSRDQRIQSFFLAAWNCQRTNDCSLFVGTPTL